MANILRIELKREYDASVINNKIVESEESCGIHVYACCDELSVWIGTCEDIDSLNEIAGPDNLITSIIESASEYENIALMAALKSQDYKYDFFEEIRIAKER